MAEHPPGRAPASLLARTNLTLGISAILIAVIATVALYNFVIDPISEQSADDEAALLVLSAQTWVELPPAARPYFELELAENHDLIISEARLSLPVEEDYPGYFDLLKEQLGARLGYSESEVQILAGDELYWVDVPMGGYDLQIGFSPQRRDVQPLYSAIVIVSLGAAIVFFTSLFIVQRIARPLVKVAQQAESFRGAKQMEPLVESGPRELASLARNFNTMAQEISQLLANRTTLLAGISHDLKTPLTRMRLALALLPESVDPQLIARFERNLESMDELISDALRFARGTSEAAQEIELVSFVEDILRSFDQSIPLHTRSQAAADDRVTLAPSAFRRVLVNLIGNGIQHGGEVEVCLGRREVRIRDN
ncbi:MAG: histidine kinase dimerization/phospho-acceptor domain-containing protein, partial [Pseudomonadota bacterium]